MAAFGDAGKGKLGYARFCGEDEPVQQISQSDRNTSSNNSGTKPTTTVTASVAVAVAAAALYLQ